MDPSSSSAKNEAPQITNKNEQTLDTHKNYDQIISTVKKGHGWGAVDHLYLYQGFRFSSRFLRGTLWAQEQFTAQPNDILLCSSLKTGTTWLKALAFAVITRHKFNPHSSPLNNTISHECVPFIELDLFQDPFKRDPELPLVATHMAYTSLPTSIVKSVCKIVYIYRDPKDSFVSLWHFIRKMTPKDKELISLEEAFKLFTRGVSLTGPFWDHVLGYWKASLERPETVFVMKYEDIKTDSTYWVKKLAEFMGYSFTFEEEKKGMIENIVELCSFDNLSSLEVNKGGVYRVDSVHNGALVIENNKFFRKGMIGDWKNYLTTEMADEMDKITKEKFGPYGLN